MSQTITFVVTLAAKPEHSDAVRDDLTALLDDTRGEPGCLAYTIHRSNDRPTRWMVYETWASQGAFDAHLEQPYTRGFMATLDQRLAEPISIAPYTIVG